MVLNNTPSNYICLLINIPDVSKFTAIQRSAFIYPGCLIQGFRLSRFVFTGLDFARI